jgi:signal peptidase I
MLKLLALPLVAGALLALYLTGSIPYRVYVVHTGSMSPAIPSRSAVLVHVGHYRVGQVISFREHGATVTHRLVALNGEAVTTKGDADRSRDPWQVRRADIIGGVVLAPHFVGFALVYVRSPLGAASILLAFLAVWQTVGLTRALQPSGREARTVTIRSRST